LKHIFQNKYPIIYDAIINVEKIDRKNYSADYLRLFELIDNLITTPKYIEKNYDYNNYFINKIKLYHMMPREYEKMVAKLTPSQLGNYLVEERNRRMRQLWY